uniref:Uncharacterized protein n=1 Tax=Opuntia streptacantha TaxID=393608 RepID=A0A7C9EFH8_OPUST
MKESCQTYLNRFHRRGVVTTSKQQKISIYDACHPTITVKLGQSSLFHYFSYLFNLFPHISIGINIRQNDINAIIPWLELKEMLGYPFSHVNITMSLTCAQ